MHSVIARGLRAVVGSTVSLNSKPRRARASRRPGATARAAAGASRALLETLEDRTLLSTTYYVSPSGNDNNSGTSSSSPWKDISKANSVSLGSGDSLLFQGGQTFYGELQLSNDSGATIGSYGGGNATINSGTSDGAYADNVNNLTITNLNFVGQMDYNQDHNGIVLDCGTGRTSSYDTVSNCNVSGYDYAGINTTGYGSFDNLSLTGNSVHNNWLNGIMLSNGNNAEYINKNFYAAYNTVYDNYGSNNISGISGSGMDLNNIDGGMVEYNDAYNNGGDGDGGCGIWTGGSTGLTFQYNISHNNETGSGNDGDGFDFDLDTNDSIMQYNYAYDNDGNGFQINQWSGDNKNYGNIIRYNIAQDNGQKNNYSGLEVWGQVENAEIYNNTVYVAAATRGGSPSGIKAHNSSISNLFVSNVTFANNIIVTANSTLAVYVPAAETAGAYNLKFVGNDYWASSGSLAFSYGNGYYTSLSSFQSGTGQEKLNGSSTGLSTNPDLQNAGGGASLDNPSDLYTLSAYSISTSSPVIDRGVSLSSIGAPTVSKDFFGDSVPSSGSPDVGADQVPGGSPSSSSGSPSTTSSSSGSSSSSSSSSNSSSSSSSLPSGWSSIDIGSVGSSGSASYSGGTYSVSGSGADFSGTSDAFHYVYTSLTGNGTIVAEVSSLSDANSDAKAGIMFRDGIQPGDKEVSVSLAPDGVVHFDARTTEDGNTNYSSLSGYGSSVWLELVRNGDVITAYVSSDDKNWTEVGTGVKSMSSTLEVGLAVTAHDAGAMESAKFSNVSVSSSTAVPAESIASTSSLPSGWTSSDIGDVVASGGASYSNGVYTVSGSGADITGTADAFQYVYTSLSGDGSIVAEVSNETDANSAAKAGVMFRDGTGADAAEVSIGLAPDGSVHMDQRTSAGGNTSYSTTGVSSSTEWLKLVRSGNTITAYVSPNDSSWQQVGSITLSLDSTLEVGLDVTAHDAGAIETANFSNVSVS